MLAAGMMIAASLGATQDDRAARTVEAVIQCRAIADDTARLVCFDQTAQTLESAKSEVIREVKKERKQDRKVEREKVKQVDSTISRVTRDRSGFITLTLADDSVWTFTTELPTEPEVGDAIQIKSATFGSYMGSVKGRVGTRIRRIR